MLSYDNIITITGSEQRLLDFLKVHTEVIEVPTLHEICDEFINTVYRDQPDLLHDERARHEFLGKNGIRYPKWPFRIKQTFIRKWYAFESACEIIVMSEIEVCLRIPTRLEIMADCVFDLSRWYPDLQFLLEVSQDSFTYDEILMFRDGELSEEITISSFGEMWNQENRRTISFASNIIDEKDGQLRLVVERRGIDNSWVPIWTHGVEAGGLIDKAALEESRVDQHEQPEARNIKIGE